MAEVITNAYEGALYSLPSNFRILVPLFIFAVLIALYGIFTYLFYRFLARRDILKLNLKKYNVFEHSGFLKFFAVIFYIIEFAIIVPIVITIWFALLSILLITLVRNQPVSIVLLISAAIIGAVRITSYFTEDLSKDLAKMFPFTLLGVAILTPDFFQVTLDTLMTRISEIPTLFSVIIYYAVFIAAIEIIFRLFYIAQKVIRSGGEAPSLDTDWDELREEN